MTNHIVATKEEILVSLIALEENDSLRDFQISSIVSLQNISASLLDDKTTGNVGEIGKKLEEMIKEMKGLKFKKGIENPSFFESHLSDTLLAKIIRYTNPLTDLMSKYSTIKDQLVTIVQELNHHLSIIDSDIHKQKELSDQITIVISQYENARMAINARLEKIDFTHPNHTDYQMLLADVSGQLVIARQIQIGINVRSSLNKKLFNKIDSQIKNSIPQWQILIADALLTWNTRRAAAISKKVDEFQNQLVIENAKALRAANSEVLKLVNTPMFTSETITQSTNELVGMFDDTKSIVEDMKVSNTELLKTVKDSLESLNKENPLLLTKTVA